MEDHLVRIGLKDLAILKKLFKDRGPTIYVTYTAIKNYNNWIEKNPKIENCEFFSLNGDFADGTFVVIDRYIAYTDTLNEDQSRLLRLLKLLDFSKGFTFFCTRNHVRSTILEAIKCAGVDFVHNDFNLLYRCPKEHALEFDVRPPTGIHKRELKNQSEVEKINAVWPHRTPYTLKFFERLAKYNLNVGAFTDDGILVSWTLRDPIGFIGALQTDEKYFGRGLGKLVVKSLAKSIAESGDDVYASIYEDNTTSRKLFARLGFEVVGEVNWIVTKYVWADE